MKKNIRKVLFGTLAISAVSCVSFALNANNVSASAEASALTSENFAVLGASVKLTENDEGSGIRFFVGIDKDVYADMTAEELANVHILVMPKKLVDGALEIGESYTKDETTANAIDEAVNATWFENEKYADYMLSCVYVYNYPTDYYGEELTARAYYRETESTEPVYTDELSRSFAFVADYALHNDLSDTQTSRYDNAIVVGGVTKYTPYDTAERAQLDNYTNCTLTYKSHDGTKKLATKKIKYGESFEVYEAEAYGVQAVYMGMTEANGTTEYGKVLGNATVYMKETSYYQTYANAIVKGGASATVTSQSDGTTMVSATGWNAAHFKLMDKPFLNNTTIEFTITPNGANTLYLNNSIGANYAWANDNEVYSWKFHKDNNGVVTYTADTISSSTGKEVLSTITGTYTANNWSDINFRLGTPSSAMTISKIKVSSTDYLLVGGVGVATNLMSKGSTGATVTANGMGSTVTSPSWINGVLLGDFELKNNRSVSFTVKHISGNPITFALFNKYGQYVNKNETHTFTITKDANGVVAYYIDGTQKVTSETDTQLAINNLNQLSYCFGSAGTLEVSAYTVSYWA